jgi:hypothetical protein
MFGLKEDGMGGIPASAGDMDELHATSAHLSLVPPEGVDAEGVAAPMLEIAHVQPGVSEHGSMIFAW